MTREPFDPLQHKDEFGSRATRAARPVVKVRRCHMDIALPALINSNTTFQPRTDGMEQRDLERELERLHSESWGWALACCGRNAELAEDVLQTAYLRIISRGARFNDYVELKARRSTYGQQGE